MSTMCQFFGVSRSGYYDFVQRLHKAEKDTALAERIQIKTGVAPLTLRHSA